MKLLAAALEVAGLVAVAVGCWMLAPWLGVIVGGLLAIAAGMAVHR